MKYHIVSCGFNCEPFIEDFINSMKTQGDYDITVHIYDDASTDNTWSLLQSYANDRFHLYRNNERKGAAYCRYSLITKIKDPESIILLVDLDELIEMKKNGKKEFRNLLRDSSRSAFSKKEALSRIDKEKYVIRLLVPEDRTVTFTDLIRGEISFHTSEIDDQVLLKSDGYPTYHLAVVVDDYLMKITHVIRAEDWISSTPKHVLLYDAFGWKLPIFAHTPLLRNPDKSKLSKRKNPVWASWYLEKGFLPQAILNYLGLMGWSHPEQKEIFSLDEFISLFKLEDIDPVGPAFDQIKLEWMNGVYIRSLSVNELAMLIKSYYSKQEVNLPEDLLFKTIPISQERIKKLSDYMLLCGFFYKKPTEYENDISEYKDLLIKIHKKCELISLWSADVIGEELLECAEEENIKNKIFFQLLRIVITGKKISPPLNESMEILGKNECLMRIRNAISC